MSLPPTAPRSGSCRSYRAADPPVRRDAVHSRRQPHDRHRGARLPELLMVRQVSRPEHALDGRTAVDRVADPHLHPRIDADVGADPDYGVAGAPAIVDAHQQARHWHEAGGGGDSGEGCRALALRGGERLGGSRAVLLGAMWSLPHRRSFFGARPARNVVKLADGERICRRCCTESCAPIGYT